MSHTPSINPPLHNIATNLAQHLNQADIRQFSTITKSVNLPWGDMIIPKQTNCRIAFQNINGITSDPYYTDATMINSISTTLEIDILGLIETNVDWETNNTKQRCKQAMRSQTPNKIQFSSFLHPPDNNRSTYLPGGTLMIAHSPWSSRVTPTSDPTGMGRWSEMTLHGKDNQSITIITAYRVCNNGSFAHDSNTAFNQQWRHLHTQNIPNPCPRQIILDDLANRIAEIRQTKSEVLLLIDANESSHNINSPLMQWAQDNKLIDVLLAHHGTDDEPETYIRGSQRIDYIFSTHLIYEFIQRSGILPYYTLGKGDHRPLYIDIDLSTYLKNQPSIATQRMIRGVITNNPKAVKLYRKRLQHFFDTTHFQRDMTRLQKKIDATTGALPQQLQDEYNRLDTWLTKTCIKFDKECSRIPNIDWSPTLMMAKHKERYWSMWISEILTGRKLQVQRQELSLYLNPSKRQQKMYEYQLHYDLPTNHPTLSEAYKQKRLATGELTATVVGSAKLREDHLHQRAEAAIDVGKTDVAQIIRQIRHIEKQKRSTTQLRNIMKPDRNGGISHILIDDDEGTLTTIFDKDTIHQLIIQRNKSHFSQAESTPLTTSPLKQILGPYATSPESTAILDGTYDIESIETTRAMKDILIKYKRLVPPGTVDSNITTDDVRNGYKRWRESTTTSPSSLHLGHVKALFHFDKPDETENNDENPFPTSLSELIFEYQSTLMNNAIQHKFAPERWSQVLNIMLEKSPGNPYLPKLRIIQITEKDENLLMGITIGRRLVSHGEMLKAFGDEQGGSRPDRQTGEISLFKHFMFSISRTTQTDLATFDNDAKSCYDRIVMTLASLAAQRLGISYKVCELLLHTLQSHQHKISTQHGISTEHFSSTDTQPIHGPGQGGKSSSAIWMIISTLLMECMANESDGAIFTDPLNSTTVQQRMTGFVDDTTHWINNDPRLPTDNQPDIIQKMNNAAQYWEQLLHASGGKLELSKCFFYHMKWAFTNEGKAFLDTLHNNQTTTTIIDSANSSPITINAVQSNESHKTLGILETPDGTNKDEYKRLKQKSGSMARRIATATISGSDASTLYYTMYIPSITYSFTVGTFTAKQLHQIQIPVKQAILPKLGYNRRFPLEVTFGPTNIGGLGLRHLFAEQGTIKTIILLKQLRIERPLGRLARIKLAWDQRIAGIGHSILSAPFLHCPQINNELWTTTLREFLSASELEIYISNFHIPTIKRENDIILMDYISLQDPPQFTDPEIIMINRCRLYLQCETIADITNIAGTTIKTAALQCNQEGRLIDNGRWPNQPPIGPIHRRVWKKFLKSFLRTESLSLATPLGRWKNSPINQQWNTYINYNNSTTMIFDGTSWTQYNLLPETRHGFPLGAQIPHQPDWLLHRNTSHTPTDSFMNASNRMYIVNPKPFLPIPLTLRLTPTPIPTTFHEKLIHHISTIPEWESALIQHAICSTEIDNAIQILNDPQEIIYIVSDGGYSSPTGSFGWVIATHNTILFENNGIASGTPMNSYRAEAFGKLSWIIFLKHLYQIYHGTPKCKIVSYLDNKEVVKQSSIDYDHQFASTATQPDFDILIAIQHEQSQLLLKNYNISSSIHVKGHQDDTTQYHDLPRPAQLNIRADELATNALQHHSNRHIQIHHINPHCHAYLMENGNPITSNEQTKLRWKWSEIQLQNYYLTRYKITTLQLTSLNWAGINLTRQLLSKAEIKFTIKRTTDWLPTGSNMAKYGHLVTNCHRCNDYETFEHLYTCTHNINERNTFVSAFHTALIKANTSPDISDALLHATSLWLSIPCTTNIPQSMQHSFNQQTSIGWKLFFKGLLIQNWSQHQQAHIDAQNETSHTTGDTWNKHISKFLIQQAHQMWISRCNEVHEASNSINISKSNQEAIAQITRIYDTALSLPIHDQQTIFHTPLSEHITKGSRYIRQWVTRNAQIIRHMTTKSAQHHSGQNTLLKYWQRKNTNTKINETHQSELNILR